MSQSRNESRSSFSDTHRIILLEQDMDDLAELRNDMKAIRGILLQVLVGVAVACVMLAINLGVAG